MKAPSTRAAAPSRTVATMMRPLGLLGAMALFGCGPRNIAGDDGARAIQERHVDADRLGSLMNQPTLTVAIAKVADPWTRVMSGADTKAFTDDISYKTAVGVGLPELLGIDLDVRGYSAQIVDPLPGSAAAKAGLMTGDIVETVDGKPCEGRPWKEIMAALRVGEGKTVELGVRNRREGLRTITLKSEPLAAPVLVEGPAAGTPRAAIHLRGFTDQVVQDVTRLLASLEASELELDLRDNPGGSLTSMLAVAGLFVGQKPVLVMRGPKGAEDTLRATGEQRFTGTLTVRVNGGTASAAEALAIALRSIKRATVVGDKTFGKCLVHDLVQMADGRGLLMTIGRLHAPGQQPWCGEGIAPDTPESALPALPR